MTLLDNTLQTVQYFDSLRNPVISETLKTTTKSWLAALTHRIGHTLYCLGVNAEY